MSFGRPTRRRPGEPEPVVPPLTFVALERSAQWHLGRRALTTAELRAALQKKAARHAPNTETPGWIETLVQRLTAGAVLDDQRVAEARIESGRNRGWSKRRIGLKLRGVEAEVRDGAFAEVDTGDGGTAADAELAAAVRFVEKKRLREKDPQKALGALARQGFSFAVARASLATPTDDDDA